MASDGTTGQIPVASPVQGSQATSISIQSGGGRSLPQTGNIATAETSARTSDTAQAASNINKAPVQNTTDPDALVKQLNKYLNDSGRPDQFRLDPASNGRLIQQVNPASGEVIGEFSASEFPALARSVGGAGLLIDSLA
jgi:uncharacterized FlaG/YvyC family protein